MRWAVVVVVVVKIAKINLGNKKHPSSSNNKGISTILRQRM